MQRNVAILQISKISEQKWAYQVFSSCLVCLTKTAHNKFAIKIKVSRYVVFPFKKKKKRQEKVPEIAQVRTLVLPKEGFVLSLAFTVPLLHHHHPPSVWI